MCGGSPGDPEDKSAVEEFSWDELLIEGEDKEETMDWSD